MMENLTQQMISFAANETLLASIKVLSGTDEGKVKIHLAEHISNPNYTPSAVAVFNPTSMGSSGPRQTWFKAEIDTVHELLGSQLTIPGPDGARLPLELYHLTPDQDYMINVINPIAQGQRLRVIVKETNEPNMWLAERSQKRCKRLKSGVHPMKDNRLIFSETDFTLCPIGQEPDHIWLVEDNKLSPGAIHDLLMQASESQVKDWITTPGAYFALCSMVDGTLQQHREVYPHLFVNPDEGIETPEPA